MAQRRSPHRVSSSPANPSFARRIYSLRRGPLSKRALTYRFQRSSPNSHASGVSSSSSADNTALRPVLATLHPNLRRLPSRLYLLQADNMRDVSQNLDIRIGTKRKRVVSLNENAHSGGRPTRGSGTLKRRRGVGNQGLTSDDDSGESQTSSMEVDLNGQWTASDQSDADSDADESSDEFLINEAVPRQLLRLRKDELVRLYVAAGLSEDAETLTKPEIVDAIVAARDDVASLPPSSPPGRGDDNSSDFSSDDGNVAGGEETDVAGKVKGLNGLRRRATVHDVGHMGGKFLKTRSFSMGHLNGHQVEQNSPNKSNVKPNADDNAIPTPRKRATRACSSRSSPTPSTSYALPSPPATRLRSRKVSAEKTISAGSSSHKAKGKGKQVEFSDHVEVQSPRSIPPCSGDESELTDLAELEEKIATSSPSPRRLRSRDKGTRRGEKGGNIHVEVPVDDVGATPRKGVRGKSIQEEIVDDGEDDEEIESKNGDDEDEIDELVSSPSPSPSPPPLQGRRTPVRRRLRPRRVQTHTPPSDGDDEGENEEEDDQTEIDIEDESDEIRSSEDEDGYEGNDTEPVTTTPRKLRSGKVVGEEEVQEEDIGENSEEDEEEEDEEEGEEDEVSIDAEDVDVDVDTEGENKELEDDDELMHDEDVDLTIATAKTLVRLRRDDLVRLCETRDLEVVGTKPQLAQALLQWRDRHANGFSSPSSTGTIRPPSTARPRANGRRRTKSRSNSKTPPVLMRSRRVHQDEPRTPPLSRDIGREAEPELELDLESLGLEDREIPPEKLTKLEKIGSGGFKDVYIGKFKGRRVAIAEFRDQLSPMDIKELKLLGGFDHANIVRFLGVSIPENTRETPVMIVSELCSNGDLFDYVRNVPAPSLHKVINIMLDIARGLEYLHMRKPSVIHRDCKSSNILITSRATAKIADFGLAKVKQSTRSMVRSLVGTVNWQAPELWHAHPKYNHKVDVFSCAMVYWEMLQWHNPNKKFPWEGMNEHAIYEIVGAKRQRPSISGLRKLWCPEIIELLERMWAHDPQDRPTMSEVVEELEHLASQR